MNGAPGLWVGLGFGCGGHSGSAFLGYARQVWRDAEHPLDQHELTPVVHFLLFDRKQHVEVRAGGWAAAGRHGNGAAEEVVGEGFYPGLEVFAGGGEAGDDLGLGEGFLLGGGDGADEGGEIEAFHGGAGFVAEDGGDEAVDVRDVNEDLGDGAGAFGGAEAVLVFRDVVGDLEGVVAHGAEAGGDFF